MKTTAINVVERHTLDEAEAARFLGLRSAKTLYGYRREGIAPRHTVYGGKRLIRYSVQDLLAWQREQVVK